MGNTQTHVVHIDDARARWSISEWTRLTNAFQRLTRLSDGQLDATRFRTNVLPQIPPQLADRIFDTLDIRRATRLSQEDFLCGITALLRGEEDEVLTILFKVYDENNNNVLSPHDMHSIVHSLRHLSTDSAPRSTHQVLKELFPDTDSLLLEDFLDWGKRVHNDGNSATSGLVDWMFRIRALAETTRLSVGTNISKRTRLPRGMTKNVDVWLQDRHAPLSVHTKLQSHEMNALEKMWFELMKEFPLEVTIKQFSSAFIKGGYPSKLSQHIAWAFTTEKKVVDVRQYIIGISSLCRGELREQLEFFFSAFDISKSGTLSSKEMIQMMVAVDQWKFPTQIVPTEIEETPASPRLALSDEAGDEENDEKEEKGEDDTPHENDANRASRVEAATQQLYNFIESDTMSVEKFVEFAQHDDGKDVLDLLRSLQNYAAVKLGLEPEMFSERRDLIVSRMMYDEPIQVGESYNVIDPSWWRTWCAYINLEYDTEECGRVVAHDIDYKDDGVEVPRPGPIDNKPLIEAEYGERIYIRKNMKCLDDWVAIPCEVYEMIVSWFGGGGPNIIRTVIGLDASAVDNASARVIELFPRSVVVHTQRGAQHIPFIREEIRVSLQSNVTYLRHCAAEIVGEPMEKVRLWVKRMPKNPNTAANKAQQPLAPSEPSSPSSEEKTESKSEEEKKSGAMAAVTTKVSGMMTRFTGGAATTMKYVRPQAEPEELKDEQTVDEAKLTMSSVYIEVQLPDGSWEGMVIRRVRRRGGEEEDENAQSFGVAGLYNLGNTCFMNAAVQCLSHTNALTQYFEQNVYVHELNEDNVLGHQGRIPVGYAELIKQAWGGTPFAAYAPRRLKSLVERLQPDFVGHQQHDAQEFLQFLLDGLHEDLNRVHEKPYIEDPDSEYRGDIEVAELCWDAFLQRNKSIMVDLFMGQFKSSTKFECGRVNNKFDTYGMVSLPIPSSANMFVEAIVMFNHPYRVPIRVSIEIDASAPYPVQELRKGAAQIVKIPPQRLIPVDIYKQMIYGLSTYDRQVRTNDVLMLFEAPQWDLLQRPKAGILTAPTKFRIGKHFDICDNFEKWYEGEVLDMKVHESYEFSEADAPGDYPWIILFHYLTWSAKWDEWIPANSPRIATLGSKTKRPIGRQHLSIANRQPNIPHHVDFVKVFHRRSITIKDFVIRPVSSRIFGLPFVTFIPKKGFSCYEFYALIWERVQRFASLPDSIKSVLSERGFNRTDSRDPNDENNNLHTLVVPPFILRRTKRNGVTCSRCSWDKFCFGCAVPMSKTTEFEMYDGGNAKDEHIAIDWNEHFFEHYLSESEMKRVYEHSSLREHEEYLTRPIQLEDCIREFGKEEKMNGNNQTYCSECRDHQDSTRTLELWSVPPIAIFHLKRLVGRTRKINTRVEFPIRNFDVRPFLVPRNRPHDPPSAAWLTKNGYGPKTEEETGASEEAIREAAEAIERQKEQEAGGHTDAGPAAVTVDVNEENAESPLLENGDTTDGAGAVDDATDEKDDRPPLPAENMITDPYHGVSEEPYHLFGVVNHLGLSGGGHYIAYCLCRDPDNPSGAKRWFLFDDSRVSPVHSDEVCSNNAYMLFYARNDVMNDADHLTSFLPSEIHEFIGSQLTNDQLSMIKNKLESEKTLMNCGNGISVGERCAIL